WRFLAVLLGDEPVLSPRVAFYQRLAARDQDEAAEIAEKELEKRPAAEVFDDVLVPALAAARRDFGNGRLSEDDVGQITQSVREVAEEVAVFKPADPAASQPAERVRILLVPANDRADYAAADLFARLLEPGHWEADVAPAGILTGELLDRLEKDRPAAVVIISLPPGGLTHTRYLCKRLRHRFPEVKVVVCRWTAPGEEAVAGGDQLQAAGADEVTGSLESTRTFLHGWQAVLAEGVTTRADAPRKRGGKAIGTTRA
ncbi:MAG TPA: B12-binding domain-containing protein, partial [Gemmataceae bacterium]|nr:B12-binding domain-containing protein [Gemmataceae bacterium]